MRGYKKEYDQISRFTCTEPIEIVKSLIKIFEVETDDEKITQGIYMLQYLNEKRELLQIYEEQSTQVNAMIDDYVTGYRQMIDGIVQNPDDIALIKANIAEIVDQYLYLFQLDYRNLFKLLSVKSYLAIMCLLMQEQARNYYLPSIQADAKGTEYAQEDFDEDKKELYRDLCGIIKSSTFKEKLGAHLQRFSGNTEAYWKDIKPSEGKYMIISMQTGDYVRSAGKSGGDLGYEDILNHFVILDGIDYKSNNASHELLYMEV